MLATAIQILAGLALLVFGADKFVTGAARTARRLGVKPLIIGLTVVGFATSLPEMLVSAVAAWQHKTDIAVGNAFGSNIANIALVLGATLLVRPFNIHSATLRREFVAMCAACVLGSVVLFNGYLDRADGVVLILALCLFLWWIVFMAGKSPRTDPLATEFKHEYQRAGPLGAALGLSAMGLVLLLLGSKLLVDGAVVMAQALGLSDLVIGLTVVAVGTSLPELAASLMSAHKQESDIAIGNVIGSNMFNMLAVLGVPALIHPAAIGSEVEYRDVPVMLFLTALMGWMAFSRRRERLGRIHGLILLLCFIAYELLLFHSASPRPGS